MSTSNKNNVFAILSLVFGILAIMFPLPSVGLSLLTSPPEELMLNIRKAFMYGYVFALPLAVVSTVFGNLVRKKVTGSYRTIAKIGLIVGIIALVLTVPAFIYVSVVSIMILIGYIQFFQMLIK